MRIGKTSFPWTTVALFGLIIAAIVTLSITGNINSSAYAVLVGTVPLILTGTAYAENANKEIKNGLIVGKTKQALEETGVTAIAANAVQNTNTVMGALLTHTQALQTLLNRNPPEEHNASVHG